VAKYIPFEIRYFSNGVSIREAAKAATMYDARRLAKSAKDSGECDLAVIEALDPRGHPVAVEVFKFGPAT
jgi:hypothetical protein